MQNKPLNIEPAFLSSAASNLLNCAITSLAGPVGYIQTQPYVLLKHIRLMNIDTASAHVCTLFKGATGGSAAGTQFAQGNVSIPPQTSIDWFAGAPGARFDAVDFLTGIADAANKVVINMEGEIGIS